MLYFLQGRGNCKVQSKLHCLTHQPGELGQLISHPSDKASSFPCAVTGHTHLAGPALLRSCQHPSPVLSTDGGHRSSGLPCWELRRKILLVLFLEVFMPAPRPSSSFRCLSYRHLGGNGLAGGHTTPYLGVLGFSQLLMSRTHQTPMHKLGITISSECF